MIPWVLEDFFFKVGENAPVSGRPLIWFRGAFSPTLKKNSPGTQGSQKTNKENNNIVCI